MSDINTAEFFGYGHTFTGVNIPANANQAVSMTAIFSGEPSCRFTDDVYTGRDCGPCIISALDVSPAYCNDNDTPYDATDDFFNPMIEVYYEEHPASGNLIIEGNGVNETVPVSELSYDDGYYRFYDIFFPANGMGGSIKAKFSAESSCFKEVSFGGTPACSVDGICDAENATITQPVRGTYVKEVNNTITAENKIYNYDINGRGTEATYKAGQKIILESGFHAHNGSKFHAFIGSCTTSNKEEITNNEPISLRNYPNPFTGQTTIEFKLTKDTPVTLFVSDVTGRQIAVLLNNDEKTEGTHSVIFDGNNYPAGMYYYTGEYYGTQKMVLAK